MPGAHQIAVIEKIETVTGTVIGLPHVHDATFGVHEIGPARNDRAEEHIPRCRTVGVDAEAALLVETTGKLAIRNFTRESEWKNEHDEKGAQMGRWRHRGGDH